LTILRAFFLAGRPQQATPLGSYTEWSRAVRDALTWLSCADPVTSMEIIRNKDPARNALLAVVTQWLKAFGTDVTTVAKLIEKAEGKPETKDRLGSVIEPGMPADPELKQALVG
jgi:putative DNA primase/helicase